VLIVLAPDGKIARYLYGLTFNPRDVRLSLVEASEGKIGTTVDRFILSCFRWNHANGTYQLVAVYALRLAAALTIVVMAVVLLPLWYRSWRRGRDPNRPKLEGRPIALNGSV
jgi:protein SCO1/2